MKQFKTTTRCYKDYVNDGEDIRKEMGLASWQLAAVDPINCIFFFQKELPLDYNKPCQNEKIFMRFYGKKKNS